MHVTFDTQSMPGLAERAVSPLWAVGVNVSGGGNIIPDELIALWLG